MHPGVKLSQIPYTVKYILKLYAHFTDNENFQIKRPEMFIFLYHHCLCIFKHLYCKSENNKSQNSMAADSLSRLETKENAFTYCSPLVTLYRL